MADIKISALPAASVVNNADILVLNQGGDTKTAARSLVVAGLATTGQLSGYATTGQISGFTNTAQVSAIASAQIAAITPGSIGAVATSDIIGISKGGTGSTSAAAALTALGAMSATQAAGGDLTGNYPSPTVAKLQGYDVSSSVPTSGQVLTWNGSAWVATAPAAGGSGGGGVLFYLNYGTNPDAPAPSGSKELGRVAEVAQTSVQSGTLTTGVWTDIAGFVSDTLDPNLQDIPAGIFDFNVWAKSDANANAPTSMRVLINKWDGTTSTLIATSGTAIVSNNGTTVQTAISVVISQTDVTPSDRLYIVLQAQPTASGHTVTVDFGDGTPSHVHTTIPSVGGTGVVKVINGVPQNPASLVTDSDVSTAAPLALNKVQMGQVSVLAGDGLTGGGNLSTSRILSLTTTGVSALSYGSSTQVSAITVDAYGRLSAASNVAISASGIGAQPALTSAAPAAIFQGGTGATTAAAALSNLGGITTAALSGFATTAQVGGLTSTQVQALTSAQIAALGNGLGAGQKFDVTKTYSIGDLVTSGSEAYVSLINNNSGTTPPNANWANVDANAIRIQGVNVLPTNPQVGSVLTYNGVWEPVMPAAGGLNSAQVQALTTSQLNAINISAGTGLSGGGDLSANRTLSIAALSPDPTGTFGSSAQLASLTVNNLGQVTAASAFVFAAPSIQVFSSSGTWTKPANAKRVRVQLWGGGGGGGAGCYTPNGAIGAGGGGGGSGGFADHIFNADFLTSPVTVTIGASGAGGNSMFVNTGTNGGSGGSGGQTSFGSFLFGTGGGGGGGGVTGVIGTPAGTSGAGSLMGNPGGAASATGGAGAGGTPTNTTSSANSANGGGGAGGGQAATPVNVGGGAGGRFLALSTFGGTAGTSGGGNGGAGTSNYTNAASGGVVGASGGGGGGSNTNANSGFGGNGGIASGGGGGGAVSGAGGVFATVGGGGLGGQGYAIITTYFY